MTYDGPKSGDWVRFAPNPRWPKKTTEGMVMRRRISSNANTLAGKTGWLDVLCEDEKERSVRPSRCTIVKRMTGSR